MSAQAVSRQWDMFFPCSVERLFATVADIERYPDFMPGCIEARIVQRDEHVWRVDNRFAFGLARVGFFSTAKLSPPYALTIASDNGPWRRLLIQWKFAREGDGSRLYCDAQLGFHSTFLTSMAALTAGAVERRVIVAFRRRALAPDG